MYKKLFLAEKNGVIGLLLLPAGRWNDFSVSKTIRTLRNRSRTVLVTFFGGAFPVVLEFQPNVWRVAHVK